VQLFDRVQYRAGLSATVTDGALSKLLSVSY
jgi:hypothetical protein